MLASRYFPFSGIRIAQSPAVNCQGDGTVDNYYFTPPFQFSGPSVGVVATGGTLFFSPFPSIIVPNDVLAMLPSSPDLSAPNLVVTRFTAPTTDVFNITGSFTDLQRASVSLAILVDGGDSVQLFLYGIVRVSGNDSVLD
jgi:hypothetical protein